MEPLTIVAMPRDHFSTMETCLDHVFKNTRESFDLWVLSGGTPEAVKKRWEDRYAGRVRFTYFPEFMNGAELRNYACKKVTTRLAVFLDSDVFVRPGWLAPLVACQNETGAALVSPLILDRDDRVHTAGNDLFITTHNGKSYGKMELRFHDVKVYGPTNLVRRETMFAEMHCQLVDADIGKNFEVFDGNLREFQEMDAGLTLSKQGYKMMFEPESVVYLYYETQIRNPVDVPLHLWKWNRTAMHEGFAYFEKKWGIDINPENYFDNYLRAVDRRVGPVSRRWASSFSSHVDKLIGRRLDRWAGP